MALGVAELGVCGWELGAWRWCWCWWWRKLKVAIPGKEKYAHGRTPGRFD